MAYTVLVATAPNRAKTYRRLVHEAFAYGDLVAVRAHLQQQCALDRDDFRAMVEAKTRRFASVRSAHRPPRGIHASRK